MTVTNSSTATANDRELVITRIFDAPRETVFKAWTKADLVARWFGPRDFTAPFCEIDFRIGGKYRICMLSPEGEGPLHTVEYYGTGFLVDEQGLINPNVSALGDWTLAAGQTQRFRYRLLVYRGPATRAQLAKRFETFAGGPDSGALVRP